jgi:hypothetical protein
VAVYLAAAVNCSRSFSLAEHTNIIEGSPWNTLLQLWPLLLVVAGLDSIYRGEGLVGQLS